MKISIKHLPDGLHKFNFVETAASCGLPDHPSLKSDVEVNVEVEKSSPNFFVTNHVRTVGRFECDRCLEEFSRPVEEKSTAVFSSAPDIIEREEEDIHPLAKDTVEIDITNDVHDALLLAVPIKSVCRPDCKGLCPRCGADLNKEQCHCGPPLRDVRWAALDKFLEKS